ncbi:hypothetical protein SRB5_40960 [Streptomyces sp. RB5]|uniref:ABC3 transporter permease C-terminal domain-containing protein n=1 Tax=Streptomyces smaragdinus TaxID=2585196 RepID=A0A7K0CKE1_9ACTN|nr:ABC transporter permease [Streptomyces smaragdinus]MQY13936.1 hypothetical protein [Streptomyces smaragdinus]
MTSLRTALTRPRTGRPPAGGLGAFPRLAKLVLRSVAARWATLTGSFLALTIGTALIAVMGRALAGTGPLPASEELTTAVALLGTAAGVTGFVSVFVVASTFSYAVAQRRRELGLLRLAGASRAFVRRLVLGEALILGTLASATGCALAAPAAPRLTAWLADERLAPPGLAVTGAVWPYHLAFWTGLGVTLAGVTAAARRAGRTAPAEALKEAAVDDRAMTPGRWLAGGGLLVTALALTAWRLATDPGELLHRKTYTVQPMLLVTAVALLAPVCAVPLCRLAGRALPGWTGRVARGGAVAAVRRTGAVAAPVLMTVALAGSLLGTVGTVNAAKAAEAAARTRAQYVVTGDVGGVRPPAGARTLASAPTRVEAREDSDRWIGWEGRAVNPYDLAALTRLPVTAGRITDLDDDGIIVTEEWLTHRVGATVPVRLADGSRRTLRIAAVLATGTGETGAYVTPANAPGATPDRLEVRGTTAHALREAAPHAEIRTAARWLADTRPGTGRATRAGFALILGIALLYGVLVLANTLWMSTADRAHDLRALRLAGATKTQTLTTVAAETLLVVTVGGLLGAAVAALTLAPLTVALAALSAPVTLSVPWTTLGLLLAACALAALPAALVPAWWRLRKRQTGSDAPPH